MTSFLALSLNYHDFYLKDDPQRHIWRPYQSNNNKILVPEYPGDEKHETLSSGNCSPKKKLDSSKALSASRSFVYLLFIIVTIFCAEFSCDVFSDLFIPVRLTKES